MVRLRATRLYVVYGNAFNYIETFYVALRHQYRYERTKCSIPMGRFTEIKRQLSSRNRVRRHDVQIADLLLPWTSGLIGVVVALVLRLILSPAW
jgi:hypothetical protein